MMVPCLKLPAGDHCSVTGDLMQNERIMRSPTPVRACLEGDTAAGRPGAANPFCSSEYSTIVNIDDPGLDSRYASCLWTPESKGGCCQGGVIEHLISPSAHKIIRGPRRRAERAEPTPVYHLLTPGAAPSSDMCGEAERRRSASEAGAKPLPTCYPDSSAPKWWLQGCRDIEIVEPDALWVGPEESLPFWRHDTDLRAVGSDRLDLRFSAFEDEVYFSEHQAIVKGNDHRRREDCCWVRLGKSRNLSDAAIGGHIPIRKERSCSDYSSNLVDECLHPDTNSPCQTPTRP